MNLIMSPLVVEHVLITLSMEGAEFVIARFLIPNKFPIIKLFALP